MKELILQALTTKFPGVAASILSRIADKLSKTVTSAEQVTTAVEGVTLQQVIDSYTDSRVTEATASAVTNYEKKHNLKDGKPVEVQKQEVIQSVTEKKGGEDDTPAWAKALIEQNKTLNDRIAKMETDRTTTSRKQQLTEITSKLPEAVKKAYDRIQLDRYSDEEFTALVAEVSTEVEGIMKDAKTKGAVVGKPSFTGSNRKEDELTEEQIKLISKREGSILKDGDQPF